MRDMSRAIRHELADYGPTLKEIPDDVLCEYVTIIGAFYADLKEESDRRARVRAEVEAQLAKVEWPE